MDFVQTVTWCYSKNSVENSANFLTDLGKALAVCLSLPFDTKPSYLSQAIPLMQDMQDRLPAYLCTTLSSRTQ